MTQIATKPLNLVQQWDFHFVLDTIEVQVYQKFKQKQTTKKCPLDPKDTFALPKDDTKYNKALESSTAMELSFCTRYN
jgi:hypothetical protein